MPVCRPNIRWIAAACAALAVSAPMAGCSKDDSATNPSAQSSASAKTSAPVTGTNGRQPTLGDYIKQNNISETQVKPGQPGTPVIALPMGPDWKDLGPATPAYAYAAIIDTAPAFSADPPSIVAVLSKLTGPVDPAQILTLAPNEIRNLPDFKGTEPRPGKLSNFDSVQISGTYTRDGQARLIAQKTVLIPGQDSFFVLQLNADGLKAQGDALVMATEAIDTKATIKQP